MATLVSAFEPTLTLDDLPNKILAKVWEQYFAGLTIVANSRDGQPPRLDSLWLINKRQSGIAKEQMLKTATIKLENARDVAELLDHVKDTSNVRHVEFVCKRPAHEVPSQRFLFCLVDDLFRMLQKVTTISIKLDHRIRTDIGMMNPQGYYERILQLQSGQAGRILLNAVKGYGDQTGFAFADLTDDTAFAGRRKIPAVHLYIEASLCSFSDHARSNEVLLPILEYCKESHSLHGIVNGNSITRHQLPPILSIDRTGGRRLCDAFETDTAVRKSIEGILRRSLTKHERVRMANYETGRLCSSSVRKCCIVSNQHEQWCRDHSGEQVLYLEMCHALLEMYGFEQSNMACRKVATWLEDRMVPTLRLDTLSHVMRLLYRGHWDDEPLATVLLERCWERSGPPKNVLDLYLLLHPALIAQDTYYDRYEEEIDSGRSTVWWEYFQLLYLTGPKGRWILEPEWEDDSDDSDDSQGERSDNEGIKGEDVEDAKN